MKILFDHQAFTMQTHGGVSRCFVELYKHLPPDCDASIALRESNNAYAGEMPGVSPLGYKYDHFICRGHFPGKGHLHVWLDKLRKVKYYPNYNKNYAIWLLQKGGYDIFHPTFFDDYFLPYLNGKPFVLTIHDMIPEQYPQYFQRDDFQIRMKRKLVPLASAIIAVSETTKRDVVRILNVSEEKVHVIYHGCSFPKVDSSRPLVDGAYILYVGDRFGYKDFELFLKYVASVLKRHEELRVICTGQPFNDHEQQIMKQQGLQDRFIHYWVSTDEEFYALYHHAVCFVYTSEYEGFGIPILEAYQADCPVMLNDASCFPEIAGDAAIYFKMTPTESNFAQQFERLYSMVAADRDLLLTKQRNRLNLYSWEKSAKQLAGIYRMVVTSQCNN